MSSLVKTWKLIYEMFSSIPCLDIPRFVGTKDGGIYQLLVFCDVSLSCYATTVYLRITEYSVVQTDLVFSKFATYSCGEREV